MLTNSCGERAQLSPLLLDREKERAHESSKADPRARPHKSSATAPNNYPNCPLARPSPSTSYDLSHYSTQYYHSGLSLLRDKTDGRCRERVLLAPFSALGTPFCLGMQQYGRLADASLPLFSPHLSPLTHSGGEEVSERLRELPGVAG